MVGLGNPGRQYESTRHNAGFLALDLLAQQLDAGQVNQAKHQALFTTCRLENKTLLLAKPQTFMNLSGQAVRDLAAAYQVPPERIVVLYDDIHLAGGRLRVRRSGSAGGHNGLKNIIAHLGTQDFPRIKIGTGAPEDKDGMIDWVIGVPSQKEREVLLEAFRRAIEAAACVIEHGCPRAMNDFN